jgi:hypothetical protein
LIVIVLIFSLGGALGPKAKAVLKSCPSPTNVFTGRADNLRQLHKCFAPQPTSVKQRRFVLYGLGGGGKSQIAFKFVNECQVETKPPQYGSLFCLLTFSSWALLYTSFSEVFFIDASTIQTIDVDLKNIALAKEIGESAGHTIQWLKQHHEEWLLLFNNADDITLNLQNFFPSCSHGNILITSRNPETRVHAPNSNCKVSHMTAGDARDLLLSMASQKVTDETQILAASIAEVSIWSLILVSMLT